MIATHGVEGGPGVAAGHARVLAAELPGITVAAGCLRGVPAIEAVAAGLPRPIAVVPLLMAEGYILELVLRRLAGIEGLAITRPVGTHPLLAPLVAEAAAAAAAEHGWRPRETVLLLVAHGTPRHPASGAAAAALAARLQADGRAARVETAFLEQAPLLDERLRELADSPVVAVGLFVDAGPHGRDDVLAAIAAAPGPVAYTGPLGRLEGIRRLIRERAGFAP